MTHPLGFRLILRHALRRLRLHWPGSLLLVLMTALACATGVAVLYAAEAGVVTFSRTVSMLGEGTTELRSARGTIPQNQLTKFYPWLKRAFQTRVFLEEQAEIAGSGRTVSARLLGVAPLEGYDRGAAMDSSGGGALVSSDLADTLGLTIPGTLTISGRRYGSTAITIEAVREDLGTATILLPLAHLQRIRGGRAEVSGIALKGADPAQLARLRPFLGQPGPFASLYLTGSGERQERLDSLLRAFRLNIGVMVLMTGLVCALALYNAAALSVLELGPELRVMRTIGFSRAGIALVVMLESLLIGLAGALAGLSLGRPVSLAAARLFLTSVSSVYLPGETFADISGTLPAGAVVAAFVGAMVMAITGSFLPAVLAARGPRPIVLPLGSLFSVALGATAILILAALATGSQIPAQLSAVGVVVLLGCAALPAIRLVASCTRPLCHRYLRVPGMIAQANVTAGAARAAVSVAATAAAAALLIGLGVMIESFRATLEEWVAVTVRSDLFIRSEQESRRDAPAWLSPKALETLEREERINSIVRFTAVEIPFRGGWTVLAGTDLPSGEGQREYRLIAGSWDPTGLHSGEAVLASETAARRFGLSVDDRLTIQGRQLRLAGIYRDYSETRGTMLLERRVWHQLTGIDSIVSASMTTAPGVDPRGLRDELAARPELAGTLIQLNRELREVINTIFNDTFRITGLMRIIVLVICAGGFVVTILQLVWERRRELRTLEMIGASKTQLRAGIVTEGGLLATAALIIGVPGGLALALILIHLVNPLSFGWTLTTVISPAAIAVPAGLVVSAAVVGAALAGMFHLKVIDKAEISDE